MTVAVYASEPHYARHCLAIYQHLGEWAGPVWGLTDSDPWGPPLEPRPDPPAGVHAVMVGSYVDARRLDGWPLIYVEHGAGQSYPGDARSAGHGSYAGGGGLDHVQLFIAPNERVAQAWRDRYPDAHAVAVGCPAIDQWSTPTPVQRALRRIRARSGIRLCFAWHWDCTLIPETRSAWGHYAQEMPAVVAQLRAHNVEVASTWHPRWGRSLAGWWEHDCNGLWLRDPSEVFEWASMLAADNTSLMYEFAALDRPVVALNAPWYRRHVEHGLRFWSDVPGPQVDGPDGILPAVLGLAREPKAWTEVRRSAAAAAYAAVDGRAGLRAAEAIIEEMQRWNARG